MLLSRRAAARAARFIVFALLSTLLALASGPSWSWSWSWPWSTPTSDVVVLSELPHEAQKTYRLIYKGGPFPYEKDGTVFGNYERLLPVKYRGYYHEYTVKTRGVRSRGARRIVCGGQEKTRPAACYYTQNHYSDFRKIIHP